MTPALEQIKALPAKWRAEAAEYSRDDRYDNSAEVTLLACAAYLDTALQALRDEAGEAEPFGHIYRVVGDDHGESRPWGAGTVYEHGPAPHEGVHGCIQFLNLYTRPAPAAEAAPQDRIDAGGCAPPVYATPPSAPADHIADARKMVSPPSAPAVEAIPQAAVWLEQNGQDATMEWQAGWDACRVEYPSRRMSAPVPQEGVDGLLRRAVPFLRDEADKYEDDGSNEPLELIRDIEAALAAGALPQGMVLVDDVTGREVELCPQHGAGYAKGCERCAADLDAMDAAAPAQGVR